MTVKPGVAVRHVFDGQRGVVVKIDKRVNMALVEFKDGSEDWCLPSDLAPARKAA